MKTKYKCLECNHLDSKEEFEIMTHTLLNIATLRCPNCLVDVEIRGEKSKMNLVMMLLLIPFLVFVSWAIMSKPYITLLMLSGVVFLSLRWLRQHRDSIKIVNVSHGHSGNKIELYFALSIIFFSGSALYFYFFQERINLLLYALMSGGFVSLFRLGQLLLTK